MAVRARKKAEVSEEQPDFGPDMRVRWIGEGRTAVQTPKQTGLQHLERGKVDIGVVGGYIARHVCQARPEQWDVLGPDHMLIAIEDAQAAVKAATTKDATATAKAALMDARKALTVAGF